MFLAPLINSELILETSTKLMGSAKSQECVHPKSMPNVKAAPMNWPEMCLLRIVIIIIQQMTIFQCFYQKTKSQNLISWGFLQLVWPSESKIFGGLSHAWAIIKERNK